MHAYPACRQYRDHMRVGIRLFMTPEYKALVDKTVSDMDMGDLEALYDLIFEAKAIKPAGYCPKPR